MKVCKNPAENTIFGGSGAPRRPQIRPEMAPKTAQEASKTAQEAPKTAQEAPKTAQEAPRTAQEAPKTTQEVPFGGRGPGTCIFPTYVGSLMVREAAGGRDQGRMTLECRFAGRWGGAYGGKLRIETLKTYISQPGRPQRGLPD